MKKVLKDVSSKGQIIVLVGLQCSKSKCDSVYDLLVNFQFTIYLVRNTICNWKHSKLVSDELFVRIVMCTLFCC